MRLRKQFCPRTIVDCGSTLLISICIPATLFFELTVVVPAFHEFLSLSYCLTIIFGCFLVFNIKTNMLAVMMVDTSIKNRILEFPQTEHEQRMWRLCTVCEVIAPPRSWHCNICKTCILKRDHHCMFTGSCVGHDNHRFFLMFLFYFFIGTLYTTIYNSIFLWWIKKDFFNIMSFIKMCLPMLMFTIDSSWNNFYLLIYELNVIGLLYSFVLLLYHGKIVLKGAVIHELKDKHLQYDFGWKNNLKMIFGEKWYLMWLSPLIKSDLPHDGIHWETIKYNTIKNR